MSHMQSGTKKISLIIVDDHRMIAEMWAELLSNSGHIEIVGLCENTDKAMELIKKKRPDLVIMDINITPLSGIDATKLIRKDSPGTKIIGVSMYTQPSFAKRMFKNGASGYVTKNSTKSEMVEAIDQVMSGQIYVCKEIKENLSQLMLAEEDNFGINKLTEREIEVLKFIKDGLSSKEIADKLFVSYRTIEVHRSHILKKLSQKNTPGLLKYLQNSSLDFLI